jgi:MFS family permease
MLRTLKIDRLWVGFVLLSDLYEIREASLDEHRRSKTLFLAVTFLYWIALYIYVPTLPIYIKLKTADLATVGMVLSMYGLWQAFARIPMGISGDLMGRSKPLIVSGIFTGVTGAIIMGQGNTIFVLSAGRALTGISAGTWVLLVGVFSTFFDEDKAILASSMLTFSASFGRMLATASTGFLNRVGGYRLPFYFAGVCGVIAIILVILIGEPRRSPKKISLRSVTKLFLRRDVLLPTVLSIVVHHSDWSVTFGFLPILAQRMGVGDVARSLLISLNIGGIAVANLLNTLLLKRVKHGILLRAGALLLFTGIMLIAVSPARAYLFIGTVCMGFAFGMMYPILMGMSIQNVDRSQRSTVIGIHQSFYAIGMFTGPWVSGIIADNMGIRPVFFMTAGGFFVLAFLFLGLLLRRDRTGA